MAESILEDVFNFKNIPTHIIEDILARLPPKAVIRCSCVCKAWLNIISEAEFVNLHLSKSPNGLIMCESLPRSTHSVSCSLVEVEDEANHQGVRRIARTDRDIPRSSETSIVATIGSIDGEISRSSESSRVVMIGSIDGLVCIKDCELIHVWNPIMGEFITVQEPGEEEYGFINKTIYGFGISSGKYRVVKILLTVEMSSNYSQLIKDSSTCNVYTIGDGVWKSIDHAPYMDSCRQDGFFFNGNLHWRNGKEICCLDLEKELFKPFPPLPEKYQEPFPILNIYKGCLSVCYLNSDLDIGIMVMKEYGVQTSWSKVVIISKHDLIDLYEIYDIVPIVKLFKDGEILLFLNDNDDKLFLYDLKRQIVQDMDINNHPYNYQSCVEATEYVSSLVSLKSLGEVNVSRC